MRQSPISPASATRDWPARPLGSSTDHPPSPDPLPLTLTLCLHPHLPSHVNGRATELPIRRAFWPPRLKETLTPHGTPTDTLVTLRSIRGPQPAWSTKSPSRPPALATTRRTSDSRRRRATTAAPRSSSATAPVRAPAASCAGFPATGPMGLPCPRRQKGKSTCPLCPFTPMVLFTLLPPDTPLYIMYPE